MGTTCPACAGCSCSVTGLWAQLPATPGPLLLGGGHDPCSLPVLALSQGPRSPGSHPAAPAAAGVSGLSQLPSPAPPPALDSLCALLCRGSSDPAPHPGAAGTSLLCGNCSRGWIPHLITGMVLEAGSCTPKPRAVGTRLLHGAVSPSQPGSSTQHPMAQPVLGALPAPAPNPPWSLLLLQGRGGSLRGSLAPRTAPTLPPFFPAGTALAGFPSRCS